MSSTGTTNATLRPSSELARANESQSTTAEPRHKAFGGLTIAGVLALGIAGSAIAVFRLGDLTLGLQTDELLSAWVTADGLGDAVARAQRFQGNSAAYFVFLWFWRQLVGDAEVMLRLPSMLAVCLAARQTVRFGRDLGSADLGALAAAVVLGGASVMQAMTTARPYGFLLLFAMVSTRQLWRYCDCGWRRNGLGWAVTLALAVAMTPFAATLGVVHAVAVASRSNRRPSWWSLGAFGALCGLLVAPLVPQILALSNRRESLVIIAPPRPIAIVIVALPWLWLVVVGVLAGFGFDSDRLRLHRRDARLVLFATWAVVPPLLLFVAGLVGDSPVFSDRYRSVGLYGGAFLVASIAVSLRGRPRIVAATAIGLITALNVQGATPQSHGWRDAVAHANAQTSTTDDVVVALNPGLVESEDHSTLSSPEWTPYLSAPLDHYRVNAAIVLVSQDAPSDELRKDRLDRLFVHDTIVVIDGPPGHLWRDLVTAEAVEAGYAIRSDTRHDALTTTVLHRP